MLNFVWIMRKICRRIYADYIFFNLDDNIVEQYSYTIVLCIENKNTTSWHMQYFRNNCYVSVLFYSNDVSNRIFLDKSYCSTANIIYDFFSYKFDIGPELHIYEWVLAISLTGTVFIILYTVNQYIKVSRYFNSLETITEQRMLDILNNVSEDKNPAIVQTAAIQIPCCIGVFDKRILLPDKPYTERELYYILLHECSHLQNNDYLIKTLINIMCAFFWWNPFAYLLKKDLNQSLEIRCDNLVVKNLNKQQRCEYLEVMLNEFKYNSELLDFKKEKRMMLYLLENHSDKLIERFRLVANNKQQSVQIGKLSAWILSGCLLIFSYSFVIQSKYEVAENEIEIDRNTFEVNTENSYIIKKKDGSYSFYNHGNEMPIEKESTKMLIQSGFRVREERKNEKEN